ncbi:TIGR04222 domain-containing membrane protein [Streptomyces resistomycificus]|uniref:TIGR04222 domain-containing membrane protein n=1 Tax=Streptomyces resistomycificus TaxID=67356 RepID=A0A0L8LGB9_9ACTN|nr:TIGR04222 domain-containing membrane protein [Streptomyces resistomycificus]KOG37139.1 hypothetical protein ADK37_12045 [Streptomyces resistomycificus]KUN95090.1 hypothetical protein AQJ84_23765 [Streptomyces resistomycificus]
MRTGSHRRSAADEAGALDTYDLAFLAGRERRVVDSALIALSERGLLVIRASRVRAVGDEQPDHPIERALVAACPGSRSILATRQSLEHSPEVEEISRRLTARGLLKGSRRRTTRAGRRQLDAAARDESLPAYVLDGPATLRSGPVRRGVLGTHPTPTGLGRSLIRLGKALEDDTSGTAPDSGGGFGCGGGGGGGD